MPAKAELLTALTILGKQNEEIRNRRRAICGKCENGTIRTDGSINCKICGCQDPTTWRLRCKLGKWGITPIAGCLYYNAVRQICIKGNENCFGCTERVEQKMPEVAAPRKLVLTNWQSPGDVLMITATVRDLHKAYPGQFITDMRTSCDVIWQYNPYVTRLGGAEIDKAAAEARDTQKVIERDGITYIPMMYPDVNRSNQSSHHYIEAFNHYLEPILNLKLELSEFKPEIYMGPDELRWMSQVSGVGVHEEFWLVNTGGKWDYTAKWPNPYTLQKVIDHFRGKLLFVQIGDKDNWQPQLTNVVDFVGMTDMRQLIRLIYHSSGVLTPCNGIMHLAAAVPSRPGWPPRACVALGGAREPTHWEAYPWHRYLSTQGALPCANFYGCWKSRCTPVGDSDSKDSAGERCQNYVDYPPPKSPWCRQRLERLYVPKCLDMISPARIIESIQDYYEGRSLKWPT